MCVCVRARARGKRDLEIVGKELNSEVQMVLYELISFHVELQVKLFWTALMFYTAKSFLLVAMSVY